VSTEYDYLLTARQLLKNSLDLPELADQIDDHEQFLDAGVNSGEIIRLVYQCEKYLGTELEDGEIVNATSLSMVAAVLRTHAGEGPHVA